MQIESVLQTKNRSELAKKSVFCSPTCNTLLPLLTFLTFEPSHEIMALFVLRKFILQTHMCSHPVDLDV